MWCGCGMSVLCVLCEYGMNVRCDVCLSLCVVTVVYVCGVSCEWVLCVVSVYCVV